MVARREDGRGPVGTRERPLEFQPLGLLQPPSRGTDHAGRGDREARRTTGVEEPRVSVAVVADLARAADEGHRAVSELREVVRRRGRQAQVVGVAADDARQRVAGADDHDGRVRGLFAVGSALAATHGTFKHFLERVDEEVAVALVAPVLAVPQEHHVDAQFVGLAAHAFEDLPVVGVGQRTVGMEDDAEAIAQPATGGAAVVLVHVRAFALASPQHARRHQFLQRTVRGHQRNVHPLAEHLRAGQPVAGLEPPGVDRRANGVLHHHVQRAAGLRRDVLQFDHLRTAFVHPRPSHRCPFARVRPADRTGWSDSTIFYNLTFHNTVTSRRKNPAQKMIGPEQK